MSKGEIGFVGLGRMGFPMARNLAQAGYRSPRPRRRAGSDGARGRVAGITPGASAREVAGAATVVFTALPNDAIVRETYLGAGGPPRGRAAGPRDLRLLHGEPGGHARDPPGGGGARDPPPRHTDARLDASGRVGRDLLHGRRRRGPDAA